MFNIGIEKALYTGIFLVQFLRKSLVHNRFGLHLEMNNAKKHFTHKYFWFKFWRKTWFTIDFGFTLENNHSICKYYTTKHFTLEYFWFNVYRKAWFTIDLGLHLIPNAYTLRHARGYARTAMRSWSLQGSRDNEIWITLVTHSDDTRLNEPGSTATWPVLAPQDEDDGYRFFRIQQNGKLITYIFFILKK